MGLEARTQWIPVSECAIEHHIAGFGPVEVLFRGGDIVGVSSTHGGCRERGAQTQVEFHGGVLNGNARRISMPRGVNGVGMPRERGRCAAIAPARRWARTARAAAEAAAWPAPEPRPTATSAPRAESRTHGVYATTLGSLTPRLWR